MIVDLPIEIWSYIFSIRRRNFELLFLKFEKTLQYRIFWKTRVFTESLFLRIQANNYEPYREIFDINDNNYVTIPEEKFFSYRARIFKFSRIIYKSKHINRSGYLWGDLEEGILTFELRIPVYWPSYTTSELIMASNYNFTSIWPENFNAANTFILL